MFSKGLTIGVWLLVVGCAIVGCASSGKSDSAADRPQSGGKSAAASGTEVDSATDNGATASTKTVATEPIAENPTTRAGRGAPDLNSLHNHAAWIYIDGEEGRYIEKDGTPQIQWVVNTPVSRSPMFRVEAYEELLGEPDDFLCALQTQESFDGTHVVYAIRATDGTFQTGRDYSLLDPGDEFTILDKVTHKEIDRIPLLSPGVYGIVAKVRNTDLNAEGLAVTYFTVADAAAPEAAGQDPEPAPQPESAPGDQNEE